MDGLPPWLPLMSTRESREMDLSALFPHGLYSSLGMSDTRVCLAA